MKHKLTICILVFLVWIALVGCTSSEEKARAKYNQAKIAANSGEVDRAEKLLQEIVDDYDGTEVATIAINELNSIKSMREYYNSEHYKQMLEIAKQLPGYDE